MIEGVTRTHLVENQRVAATYREIRTGGVVGRRGLPRSVVELMYADYLRLKSISKTGKLWHRTRQAVWEILSTAGFRLNARPRKREALEHGGLVYRRSAKGGFYRCTISHRRLLHHVLWEEVYGPVPEGSEIIFIDGDKENVTIDNLRCQAATLASRARGTRNQYTKQRITADLLKYERLVCSIANKRFRWLGPDGVAELINVGGAAIAEALANSDTRNGADLEKKLYWVARNAMAKASETLRQNIRVPSWAKGVGPREVSLSTPIGSDQVMTLEDVLAASERENNDERIEALRRALERMPIKSRELLQRRFVDGVGIRVLASEYGVRQGKLQKRLSAATARLRRMVKSEMSADN
jgi:RNA polymerase sigma factor (sigma-70 family)